MSEVMREADQEVGIFIELAHLAATAISLLARLHPSGIPTKIAMRNTLIDTFDDDERPTPPAESVAAPPVSLAFNRRAGGAGSGSGCAR
jgi:hypothetical protein